MLMKSCVHDKDHQAVAVFELLQSQACVLAVHHPTKGVEEVQVRLVVVPRLKQRLAI